MTTSPEDPEQGEEASVAEKIERGLREAIAIEQGEREAPRQRQVLITADVADVPEPPEFTPTRIKRIRRELSVSQSVFADLLAVSGSTVAAWEQGDRSPGSASRRLLELAETNPEVLMRSLERAAVTSSDEFEKLVERLAEQFADRGITRDDVEDAIRRARFPS